MILSKNFVKDYVDVDVDIKTLAEDMTGIGNEYDEAKKLVEATKLVIRRSKNLRNASRFRPFTYMHSRYTEKTC